MGVKVSLSTTISLPINLTATRKDLAQFHHLLLQVIDHEHLDASCRLNPEAFTHSTRKHGEISVDYLEPCNGSARTFPRLFTGYRVESIRLK